MYSKLKVAIGVPVMTVGLLLSSAGVAAAATDGDYTGSGVRIRTAPSTSATVVGLGYSGQGATLYCYSTGTSVNGNPYWDYHRNKTTGKVGWSSEVYLTPEIFNHC